MVQDAIRQKTIDPTEASAPRDSSVEGASEREHLLLVRVGKALFGLPALSVLELCDWTTPSPLPCAPAHIGGLISFRGRAVPLLDLARYLGIQAAPNETRPRIAVLSEAGMRVGLVCDQALGVVETVPNSACSPQWFRGRPESAFVCAQLETAAGLAGIVDLTRLLEATKISE